MQTERGFECIVKNLLVEKFSEECLIQWQKTETRQIQIRNYEHSSEIGRNKLMEETIKRKGFYSIIVDVSGWKV